MALVRRLRFDDVDDFVQQMRAVGWEGAVYQTSPGAFGVELSLHVDELFTVVRTRHATANLREIQTPDSARTFGIVVPHAETNKWCHKSFDRPVVQMMPRSDYVAGNAGGHLGYQIALQDTALDEALEQLEMDEVLSPEAHLLTTDRRLASQLTANLDRIWSGESVESVRQLVIDDLAAMLLNAFNGPVARSGVRAPVRARALRNALEYMETHLGDPITLTDVARNTNASRRTLTQAFREGLGISPMAYLKVMRLNRVRNVLARGEPQTLRVVDAANAAGFWHMGQLARDYRKLFCELPSETLGRSS